MAKGETGETMYTYKDELGQTTEGKLCQEWDAELISSFALLSNGFSYTIIISNYFLRVFFIYLASFVRNVNLSKENSFIVKSVFYVTFFNSALVLVIGSIKINGAGFFSIFLNGVYSDINSYWFIQFCGTLFTTMLLNMIYPPVEFVVFWLMRHAYRMMD